MMASTVGLPRQRRINEFAPVLLFFCALLGLGACQARPGSRDPGQPARLDDGWETAGADDVGIRPEHLVDLVEGIRSDSFPLIHGVLVVRNGLLVFEEYFPGHRWVWEAEGFQGPRVEFGPDTPHQAQSVTKSITGLLVGVAIDQGCLPGPNASVLSFFPGFEDGSTSGKEAITLAHLLTMTSGLEWNEQDLFYDNLENDVVQLSLVDDPVAYVLTKPVAHVPASTWYYNGGGPIVLGEIIRRCSGERLDRYAEERLFSPLGFGEHEWSLLSSGAVDAAGGLSMTPRDMAKIGQLVLNGGTWRGTRIVSEEWIRAMTRTWFPLGPSQGYGFLWWTRDYPAATDSVSAVLADGWGGQRIMVFPSLDLVVVFTGGSYTQQPRLDEIISRFILPAVVESH